MSHAAHELHISRRKLDDEIEALGDEMGARIALRDLLDGDPDDEGAGFVDLGNGYTLVVDADHESEPDAEEDDPPEDDDPPEEHDHGGGDIQDQPHDQEPDDEEGDNGIADAAALAEVEAELKLQALRPYSYHQDQETRAAGRQALEDLARLKGKPAPSDGRPPSDLVIVAMPGSSLGRVR